MYKYIKGNIDEIGEDYVVVENNGIGYFIYTSKNSIFTIKSDVRNIKLFTYLNVREDEMSLYGFSTIEELEMFKLLLVVTGIGPKVALGVLSTLTPSKIKMAIINNDVNTLATAPGIGKKTGKRIILELKEKIDDNIIVEDTIHGIDNDNIEEVYQALISLGYTRNEINNTLSKVDKKGLNTEEILKMALKHITK